MENGRWSIDIDIEGFSALWDKSDQTLWALCELMKAIFRVGSRCYREPPDRLFAHHIGDGFIIVSDFPERQLDRCVAICVALMHHVAKYGRFAKAAIAEGELSGIRGCYPREVMEGEDDHGRISLGAGLMTVFPVMGTSIINARMVAKDSPSGPLLTLSAELAERVSSPFPARKVHGRSGSDLLAVDWVHYETPLLRQIQRTSGLRAPTSAELTRLLQDYCGEHVGLTESWRKGVVEFLNVSLTAQ